MIGLPRADWQLLFQLTNEVIGSIKHLPLRYRMV
jgi:hypothetical protein